MTIAGVHVDIGHEAVVVRADEPLTTASSAVVGGGLGRASAIVNLLMTVTEAKVMVVAEAGVRTLDGDPASGTSTDAIVIAATGRGRRCEFGGPVSDLGWAAARAARAALSQGVDRWMREHV